MITKAQIEDFESSEVWALMSERISFQKEAAHNLAIDEQKAFEAGRYRAYEMVLSLPGQLKKEADASNPLNKPATKGKSNLFSFKR